MRAVVQDVYGSADRLRLADIDKPVIAAGEVLVRVRAAGVDRGMCHLMRGEPYLMRILGFGFRGPKNRIPGLDVAGTVAAVGAGVTRFQTGDEVFGISRGSFAEYGRCATVGWDPSAEMAAARSQSVQSAGPECSFIIEARCRAGEPHARIDDHRRTS